MSSPLVHRTKRASALKAMSKSYVDADESYSDDSSTTPRTARRSRTSSQLYNDTAPTYIVQTAPPIDPNQTTEETQLPSFIASLYDLITEPSHQPIVHFVQLRDGRYRFAVKDVNAFTTHILPKYYRTHKMTSFMRQLNNYGFCKVKSSDGDDRTYEFEHEHDLLRPNRMDLLAKIERRRALKRGGGKVPNSSKRAKTLSSFVTNTPSKSFSRTHNLKPVSLSFTAGPVIHTATVTPAAAARTVASRQPVMSASSGDVYSSTGDALQDDDNEWLAAVSGSGTSPCGEAALSASQQLLRESAAASDDEVSHDIASPPSLDPIDQTPFIAAPLCVSHVPPPPSKRLTSDGAPLHLGQVGAPRCQPVTVPQAPVKAEPTNAAVAQPPTTSSDDMKTPSIEAIINDMHNFFGDDDDVASLDKPVLVQDQMAIADERDHLRSSVGIHM
mmetsp:Transcript_596/g.844  ORF Transcript_596/g.844 Transcript_596/m.844 type:complete len:443 (-) Transcript_596:121-1449(-)|eukprot:CAMPEP_0168594796 /NCGR_PEP_ID=MMETSP0420-20121227/9094_1 /TAXON_ID=498008 /ORGANISM="Pessonella sp." /LENGTH=442 /DNA_ID=CAMNT_0008631149 /DNA_START=150 /DNA_END=1478 /DNA_ORIENTATION=+